MPMPTKTTPIPGIDDGQPPPVLGREPADVVVDVVETVVEELAAARLVDVVDDVDDDEVGDDVVEVELVVAPNPGGSSRIACVVQAPDELRGQSIAVPTT
jgi:hypothetical protein